MGRGSHFGKELDSSPVISRASPGDPASTPGACPRGGTQATPKPACPCSNAAHDSHKVKQPKCVRSERRTVSHDAATGRDEAGTRATAQVDCDSIVWRDRNLPQDAFPPCEMSPVSQSVETALGSGIAQARSGVRDGQRRGREETELPFKLIEMFKLPVATLQQTGILAEAAITGGDMVGAPEDSHQGRHLCIHAWGSHHHTCTKCLVTLEKTKVRERSRCWHYWILKNLTQGWGFIFNFQHPVCMLRLGKCESRFQNVTWSQHTVEFMAEWQSYNWFQKVLAEKQIIVSRVSQKSQELHIRWHPIMVIRSKNSGACHTGLGPALSLTSSEFLSQ